MTDPINATTISAQIEQLVDTTVSAASATAICANVQALQFAKDTTIADLASDKFTQSELIISLLERIGSLRSQLHQDGS